MQEPLGIIHVSTEVARKRPSPIVIFGGSFIALCLGVLAVELIAQSGLGFMAIMVWIGIALLGIFGLYLIATGHAARNSDRILGGGALAVAPVFLISVATLNDTMWPGITFFLLLTWVANGLHNYADNPVEQLAGTFVQAIGVLLTLAFIAAEFAR